MQAAFAESALDAISQGNQLYRQGKFNQAIELYDQALTDSPQVLEPKFNKANSYYRLDDIDNASDLYREVAAESKDMKLVTRAKYNLGNCAFQQGSKQKDSNFQKAIDEMKTAIGHWRNVLDIEPENQKAAKNIEVARLTIKDLLDQIKNQQKQQDPNQPQDPNQQNQQEPNDSQQQQKQEQDSEDPNQSEEQKEQQQQEQQRELEQKQEKQKAEENIAQQILDKEQKDKEKRQKLRRGRYQKVEKDW